MSSSAPADELIDCAVRLDRGALDEIVDRYASRLYGFMYRMTGCKEDAEDLVQEVFFRVIRGLGAYEHEGRFESWLFRIAGNVARDRARRNRTRERSVESAPSGEVEFRGDSGAGGLNPRQSRVDDVEEDRRRLSWAIDQLPTAEREVILLRHYAELSFQEIADLMGTPLGTALARSHRGLAKLRGMLEAEA